MIGLASLGASDNDIKRLTAVYWFTAEFGLCHNKNGDLRAYGAGLLGCSSELRFSQSKEALKKTLNIDEVADLQNYPLHGLKPVYFVVSSLSDVYEKVGQFCVTIQKPFQAHYDSMLKRIDVTKI